MKAMKKSDRNILIVSIIAFVLFAGLMAVATFYDLEIVELFAVKLGGLEETEYYSGNVFGRIFEVVGECPIYILSAFAASVIYWNFSKRKLNFPNVFVRICALVFGLLMSVYMFYKIFKYLGNFGLASNAGKILDYVGYVLLGILCMCAFLYFTRKCPVKTLNSLLVWSFIVIATAILSQAIAQGIKPFANRPRFRTLNYFKSEHYIRSYEEGFKRWYEFSAADPEKIEIIGRDGFKSFPSGHSTACAMVITLTAIPSLFDKFSGRKYKAIFWIVAVLTTFIVMISRVVMGAHFLSDVLTGCFITVVSYYFCNWIIKLIFKKHLKNFEPLTEHRGMGLVEESIS